METFQHSAVYIIANGILYVMMLGAVQINCERRWGFWKTLLLEAFSFTGYALIVEALPLFSAIRGIAGVVYLCLMSQVFHRGSWKKKTFLPLVSFVSMCFSEMLYMTMVPREAAVTGDLMQAYPIQVYTMYLFVNLIIIGTVALLIRAISRRMQGQTLEKQGLILLAFPLSQLLATYTFFTNYLDLDQPNQSQKLIVTVVVFVLADAALLLSFRVSERNAAMKARNEILEEQIGAQKQYYAQLTESYENIRKMRHDIDNHMYTMRTLIEEGMTQEAASYAKTLIESDTAKIRFPGCANHVIASFLEKKADDYEKSGLLLETEIRLPAETGITNPDLICALGNILDNALEACRDLDQGKVTLKTNYNKPYVSILCLNPLRQQDMNDIKHKRIPELERGIGLTILQDLAEKYDGQMTAGPEGETFKTSLILKGARTEIMGTAEET